jgi:adenylate cyclase
MPAFQISPKYKRNIYRILPFGLFWAAFGLIYSLIEKGLLGNLDYYPATGNAYEFSGTILTTGIGSALMGWILGAAEILFLNKYFSGRSFGAKVIIKTCLYLISICLFLVALTFITNSSRYNLPIYDPLVVETVFIFFNNFVFWSIIIYMGAIINITLFISEVSDNLGQGVLMNFLIGRYHKPREEDRIFMFLDMKSSTTIAEKLGHVRYYKLLNEYYADITEAVLQSSGEIYQYVGDEIVVSWKIKNGLHNNNCLRCFFLIKQLFKSVSEKYMREFGLVPGFKAGLHYGKVTTGEIGVVKKEIIFTGDVLNTTARIQSSCNAYNVDILVSDDLIGKLNSVDEYVLKVIGECELRGRDEKVVLQTVTQK